jgi:hypothetical protein
MMDLDEYLTNLEDSPEYFRFRHASLAISWTMLRGLQKSGCTQDHSLRLVSLISIIS